MKQRIQITLLMAAVALSASLAQAQTTNKEKEKTIKKNETIIIKKKGEAKEKYTIVVDGDKVTINGKPADDFAGNDVEVLTGNDFATMSDDMLMMPPPRGGVKMFRGNRIMARSNKAFLGILSEKTDAGVKVTEVTAESAADKAGLKKGDIITKVGDSKIEDTEDLYEAVGKYNPEDKVNIAYKRDGKDNTTSATLGKAKAMTMTFDYRPNNLFKPMPDMQAFTWDSKPRLGVQVQDTEEGKGVKVTDVDDESPADKSGLKEDDIITQVNGKAVNSVDEIKDSLKDLKQGDTITLNYMRGTQAQTAEVKIPKRLKTSNL